MIIKLILKNTVFSLFMKKIKIIIIRLDLNMKMCRSNFTIQVVKWYDMINEWQKEHTQNTNTPIFTIKKHLIMGNEWTSTDEEFCRRRMFSTYRRSTLSVQKRERKIHKTQKAILNQHTPHTHTCAFAVCRSNLEFLSCRNLLLNPHAKERDSTWPSSTVDLPKIIKQNLCLALSNLSDV